MDKLPSSRWRHFWILAFPTVLLLLCGPAHGAAGKHETSRYGGEYRAPLKAEPTNLDPAYFTDIHSMNVAENLFDGLVEFDQNLNVVPAIARRWKISRDHRTYTFVLRKGVKFHNGREVTAKDFIFSFTRILSPITQSPVASFFLEIQGARSFRDGKSPAVSGLTASSPYTLKIELERPFAPFLSILAMANAKVVPEEAINPDFGKSPIGTGPFRFQIWQPSKMIRLEANESYFAGRPYLDSLSFRIYQNEELEQIFSDFEQGLLDQSIIPSNKFEQVISDANYRERYNLVSKPLLNLVYLGMNTSTAPFDDPRVRQAINYAVDREEITRDITKRGSLSARSILPPGVAGFDPSFEGYPYDKKKALALLAEAGYPNGEGIAPIEIWTVSTAESVQKELQAYQRYLAKVGIQLVPKVAENWKEFLRLINEKKVAMFYAAWYADYPDPDNFLYVLFHSESKINRMGYHNAEVDALLEQGREETDYMKRAELYQLIQERVMRDAPIVSQHINSSNYLFQPWVNGIELSNLGAHLSAFPEHLVPSGQIDPDPISISKPGFQFREQVENARGGLIGSYLTASLLKKRQGFKDRRRFMKVLKGIAGALTLCILGLPMASVVRAEDTTKTIDLICVFQPDASQFEIDAYLADWGTVGVTTIMPLKFINGQVLSVPVGISSEDLSNDPIVKSCIKNQRGKASGVGAAGNGGSGDGGSGDGGSGDGGSGDGGSGDGGSGDGGSGDGGSGDGGSGDGGSGDGGSDAESECRLRFVSEFEDKPGRRERPWGVLEVYEHFYDPNAYLDMLSRQLLPDEVVNALRSERRTRPVRIAVLDTGIDFGHRRLKQSVQGGVDLVNFSTGIPSDDNGHGTHVAGTIAAKKLGVASRAELYAVKILDSNAEGDLSTLLMALQWAIDNEIDVANMSIGFREDEPVAHLAVQKAYAAGMILVAAAGNHSNWDDEGCSGSGDGGSGDGGSGDGGSGDGGSGDGGSGDGGSGDGGSGDGGSGDGGSGDGGSGDGGSGEGGNTGNAYPVMYPVMYPAKYPEVIAVGAIDSDNDPAPFSNTGPELDLMAPGVDTVSTHLDGGYGVANGTSMSSAHVSGAVALMLAVARDQDRALTPAEVKRILRATAVDGTINLVDALNQVTTQPPSGER